eukprot:1596102-Pleurochrysis_carterae.AAC.1
MTVDPYAIVQSVFLAAGVSALPRRPSGHLSAGPSSRVPARATVRAEAPTPRTQPVAASAPAPLQRRATAAVADVKLQPPDAAKPPARGASFTAVLARPQAFRPAHCRPADRVAPWSYCWLGHFKPHNKLLLPGDKPRGALAVA